MRRSLARRDAERGAALQTGEARNFFLVAILQHSAPLATSNIV